MKKIKVNSLLKFSIILLIFNAISLRVSAIDEMQELNTRLYNYYFNAAAGDLTFLASQQTDGHWTDINYTDKSITNWIPITHLERLHAMANSFCAQTDKTSATAVSLLGGIEKGFTYWFTGKYTSNNWFFNDIGQQEEIGAILVLMKDYLQQSTINTACGYLVVTGSPTLTNLVWESRGLLTKGAILKNTTYISQGVANIHTALTPTAKGVEGIQKDFAFLFHGLQLYNGGYGIYMMGDVSIWMNMLAGLSFGFSASDIEPLRNVLLQGDQWLIRRGQYDFGSAGRDITRQGGISSSAAKNAATRMLTIDPTNSTAFQNMINHINGTKNDALTGNKMFYRADYMVQKRSAYHLSVKMCSARTSGTEFMNGENAKGFWLPFGVTCLMKDAGEYSTIFPLWDWSRIPGTTATAETPTFGSTLNQTTTFVGGVSNGQCGVAALDLNKQSLTAKKSYFMFDNETVCLGAGITSTNANLVNTTIAQSILRGSVRIDNVSKTAGTDVTCSNVKWVFHDNVCYFFPDATTVSLTNNARTGSWSTINTSQSTTSFTENIFNLVIPHSLKPTNASYEYIIYPDILPAKVQPYSDAPAVKILANTAALQAVTQSTQKLTGAVYYATGDLVVDAGLTVNVDQPCAVMIDQSVEPIVVTVSDPSQSKTALNVTLKFPNYPTEVLNFALPMGDNTGMSVSKTAKTFRTENYQGISLTKQPYLPLTVGETFALDKVANCSSCATTTFSWSSANNSVASVDANGLITATGNGETVITAKLNETLQTAQCTVQVMNKIVNEQFTTTNNLTMLPGAIWSATGNVLYLTSPVGATVASPEKNMVLFNQPVSGDFTLACNMLVEETTSTWNDLCVIWNHQYPATTYYYAHLCENNDDAGSGVFKLMDGVKSAQLTDITTPLVAGVWHEVALKMKGKEAKVYLDGTQVSTTVCDSNAVGRVGMGSYNDACRFSNLRVWQADKKTAISKVEDNGIIAFSSGKNIEVQLPENLIGSKISVFDVMGRSISKQGSSSQLSKISLPESFTGVAVLLVEEANRKYFKKLIIR